MFSKVFLVCAFAFCLAEAYKDFSVEEHDKIHPLFAFQKSFVKYPYYQDYKHDDKYERQEHEYPYYNQHFYQHPFLNQYLHKYYNHQTPYIHGEEYNRGMYYPYQHWQKHDFEGKYDNFYPLHQGYQHWQGQDVENKFNHYGSFYPYHHDYQGYYYPHNVGGYKCQGVECLTHHYQGYQQGYVHPLLNKFYGQGYHHYPLYEV